ncbi:hypothetical protein P171DRAFT_511924 [Karstenula rhodostoma CBS 690.94]|uniref:Uncharacterized protein n=1 Tax=Karstenula rhodostoma CBS 690.94 TaxID=1392251 RepID=A0A9P4UC11_9PLEO|nr:hypothetical protein P171DRAFT_511924 [Karstenula rhodostoma CBS 690.94]
MLLTAAKFVLLNVLLSTALPHPGFIPKIPNAPKLPDTPATGGLTPEIPSLNNPTVPEDGRWPPETQDPKTPETPAPATQIPDNPKDTTPNQQPELIPCTIDGRKRTACTPNDNKWNALNVQAGQTENRFLIAGRAAIARLDNVKTNMPTPKNVPTDGVMNSRYTIHQRPESDAGRPDILRVVKDINPEKDNLWTDFSIRNTDANVDLFIANKRAQIDQTLSPAEIDNQKAFLDALAVELKNPNEGSMLRTSISTELRSTVMDFSFNQKYDLYRKYVPNHNDRTADERLRRDGFDDGKPKDQQESVIYTDQVMYSLDKAYAGQDPKSKPIENIVRRNIATVETNEVIEAVLEKSGQRLDGPNDVVSFDRGTPEFEAIMGTIHGKRILQMLFDYVEKLGPRRIKKVYIMRDEESVRNPGSEMDVDSPEADADSPQHYESDVDTSMTENEDSDFSSSPESGSSDPESSQGSASSPDDPKDHDMLFELEDIP